MPKMKTNKAAAKRIKISGTSKSKIFSTARANKRHLLTHKSKTQKKIGRTIMSSADKKRLKKLLPYA